MLDDVMVTGLNLNGSGRAFQKPPRLRMLPVLLPDIGMIEGSTVYHRRCWIW